MQPVEDFVANGADLLALDSTGSTTFLNLLPTSFALYLLTVSVRRICKLVAVLVRY